jgi:hypothetical protein
MVRLSRDFGKPEKRRCGALCKCDGRTDRSSRHCERSEAIHFAAWIASLRSQ